MVERYNTSIAKCRECGKPHQGNWYEELRAELLAEQLCWWCHFWLRHVERSEGPEQVRVCGELYYILPDDAVEDPRAKGFGGATYYLRFLDGREPPRVKTSNLWTCGQIPEAFRERLPDNAVFTDHRWENQRPRHATERDLSWEESMAHIIEVARKRGW